MSKRPPRQAGYPWVMPYLVVQDADAALAFYEKAFGFTKRMAMPGPDGKSMHAEMTWQDQVIMFGVIPESKMEEWQCRPPSVQGVRSPMSLYVYCEDVDALFARAVAAGARRSSRHRTNFTAIGHAPWKIKTATGGASPPMSRISIRARRRHE